MSMMASTVEKKVSDREIHQAFMVFDRDNDGVISPNELRFVMDIVGERLSDDQLKAIMKEADIDGDGVITCMFLAALRILSRRRITANGLEQMEISASLSGWNKRFITRIC
jgi:Ca2+-binding EF-hand superfamily protein